MGPCLGGTFIEKYYKRINVFEKYFSSLPGTDAGQVGLGAPDAPADNARQEPAVVLFRMDHQGTAGVALDM